MIDPSKLIASAREVYGDEAFTRMYGEIHPIPAARVRTLLDNEAVGLGNSDLRFLHTRGHANHHFCIAEASSGAIFTGDSFGLCYPDLQAAGLFIFPSTSPTDFDAVEARASLKKIVESGARQAFLTHFGSVSALKEAAAQLVTQLDFSEELLTQAIASSEPDAGLGDYCLTRLRRFFESSFGGRGWDAAQWAILAMDLELNAQGLAYAAVKARRKAGAATR
jgi:glyoxylase-like metal-dependent hydrolase (beta-lactamase superfamily II)